MTQHVSRMQGCEVGRDSVFFQVVGPGLRLSIAKLLQAALPTLYPSKPILR